jgi:small-conductance mechanosensitive channel
VDNHPGTEVEPIIFRDRLTEADVVDITRCSDLLLVRRSIRWLVVGFATLLAALALGVLVVRGYLGLETPVTSKVVSVVVLIGWTYLLFGLPRERASQARSAFRRHAADHLETEVTLSPDRVMLVNEAMRSEFQWRLVKLVVDAPAGILFCNSARQAMFWLPARLFVGNELRERVLSLAESNGVAIKRLT